MQVVGCYSTVSAETSIVIYISIIILPNYTLRIIFKVRIESAKRLMRSLGLNIDREPLVILDECCWLNAE